MGNLVLHVSGSLMYYLCRNVGGFEYIRDRNAEFSDSVLLNKQQLLEVFDETVEKSRLVFAALNPSRLSEPSSEVNYYDVVVEDLIGVAVHLATHTGQIVYITKMLESDVVDGLWERTHKTLGGWRIRS